MPETAAPKSVLIVGAGVAGLAAAWWLHRLGWRVTVVEKAANLRADGYMLGLSGPGHAVLRQMGLLPALAPHNRRINENVYYGRDDKVLLRLRYHEFLKGLDWLTVARTDLVEVLYEATRSLADIRFGTTVTDLAEGAGGVAVTLSDGTRLQVDLLIGADGIHSAIRARMFGPEAGFATRLGYRCAAFQADDALIALPSGPGGERDRAPALAQHVRERARFGLAAPLRGRAQRAGIVALGNEKAHRTVSLHLHDERALELDGRRK